MASIHLEGNLVDTLGEIDVGAVLTWTQLSNTGETLATTKRDLIIPPDGAYSIDVEFGRIRLDYTTEFTERFLAVVIVDINSTATTIPELLNAAVPVKEDVIIEMESILGDTVAAKDLAEAAAVAAALSEAEAAASAQSLNNIRYSKINSPLCRLFKKNKIDDTLSGALTWVRPAANYIDMYGDRKVAGIDVPRQSGDGWMIEGVSTNAFLHTDDFTQAEWTKSSATTLVDEVIPTAGASLKYVLQPITGVSISEVHTVAVDLKANGVNFVQIAVSSVVFGTYTVNIDLLTGAINQVIAGSTPAKVKILNDGYFRLILTTDAAIAAGDAGVFISAVESLTSARLSNYTGDAIKSFKIRAAQAENLPFATSYIANTTIPLTRLADEVSYVFSENMPLDKGGMSLFIKLSVLDTATGVDQFIIDTQMSASQATGWSAQQKAGDGKLRFRSDTMGGAFDTSGTVQAGVITDVCITIAKDTGDVTWYLDGTLDRQRFGSAGFPTPLAGQVVDIGRRSNNTAPMYGHILDFRVYDFSLNADEVSFLSGE